MHARLSLAKSMDFSETLKRNNAKPICIGGGQGGAILLERA